MNRYYPTQEILNAITALDDGRKIIVQYKNQTAEYSAYMLDLLKDEPDIIHIIDAETGEVLYIADN